MISEKQIRNLITNQVEGFNMSQLSHEQNFVDAGIDSLDHMSILLALEEEYGIHVPDEALDQCSSIGGIIAFAKKHDK